MDKLERLTNQNYYYDVFQFQRGNREIVSGVMASLTQADYNERMWLKLFEIENLEAELDIDLVDFIKILKELEALDSIRKAIKDAKISKRRQHK